MKTQESLSKLKGFTKKRVSDLQKLQISYKKMLAGLAVLGGLTLVGGVAYLTRSNWRPYKLILVAGKKDGGSYRLSKALETVVEDRYSNLNIVVCETAGTADNLKALEGEQLEADAECEGKVIKSGNVKAQLATAQSDITSGELARSVAVLYEDTFQLFIWPEEFGLDPNEVEENFNFSQLVGKVVGTPKGGGQRASFQSLANQNEISYLNS